MYIEYGPGEKHVTSSNAARSDFADAFQDAGLLIDSDAVVIDIDDKPREFLEALIQEFNIHTMTVWTDRGVHFYFKKPPNFTRRRDGNCALGIKIEQLTKNSRPNGITVKRNGVMRKIDNPDIFQVMPNIFQTATKKHPYKDLYGYCEGDGRNKDLFAQRKALGQMANSEKIIRFINQHVFAEPLEEKELDGILRDLDPTEENGSDKWYYLASSIIEDYHTTVYSGSVWWYRNGKYYDDGPKGPLLKRRIYERCEGESSKTVEEIFKQIALRSPFIFSDTVFPIRFNNGILFNGQFIPYENYMEFTPYCIPVDYDPNAQPVKVVDDYINDLTSNDKDYRDLLGEVMGFAMITDPERIRSLGKFFMFRGDGANGKGTLMQIMNTIYGKENCSKLSIKQIKDDRFKTSMIGKLANLGDDIEPEAISNDEMKVLKNISTADAVSTRLLYEQSFDTTFTCKLYFTTNSDIKSFEKGYAFKRRVLWLPMFNKVEKPDPYFITKITTPDALQYWIRYLVEGYMRLYQNGCWTESEPVDEYNEIYHEENNASARFAHDLDPDEDIVGHTIGEMREKFNEWSGEGKFSSKLFKEAVWSEYRMGLAMKRVPVAGITQPRRVFLRQDDTDQKLEH